VNEKQVKALTRKIVEGMKQMQLGERLGFPSRAERNRRDEDIARRAAGILRRRGERMSERELMRALGGISAMELRQAIGYAGRRHKVDVWQGQYGMVS